MGITIHLICGPGNMRNLSVSQFEREATQKRYHRSRILLRFCNSLVYFFCPNPLLRGEPAERSASCGAV